MPKESYVQNRTPLMKTPFLELPLGSITPSGWLKDQLMIQAEGFTGKLSEHWEDVGPNSGWLGGNGESWERGPYYLDGLLPLAYLLQDEQLIAKTKPWIEWTLSSQREDGQFGPATNEDWWSRMVMIKVLIQYKEAAGDERVTPFLTKYFRNQLQQLPHRPLSDWGEARGGENILAVQWLYNRTGDAFLLELCDLLHKQTLDWTGLFKRFPFWRYQTKFNHRIHVVNVAMGLREPALYYLNSGQPTHRDAAAEGIKSLMVYHGQVHGMFSGDEWLAGTHPSQGVELCAVVEYMYTLENLVRILGNGEYGDILEKVAYNALPGTITADWHGRQYDQQANQVMCNRAARNWTENGDDANMFGLEPHFGCCTANMHQGWPKFAARLWMATEDAGLAAISYAPCQVSAHVADGRKIEVIVDTIYPFGDQISIGLQLDRPATFPLKLRIPGWCKDPSLVINGGSTALELVNGFASITREWNSKDQIILSLPMEVELEARADNAVGVQRGPLVYSLAIKERWHKRFGSTPFPTLEVFPESKWNYGLQLNRSNPGESFKVETGPMSRQPFLAKETPIKLVGKGRIIPQWQMEKHSAGTLPISPVATDEPEEEIILVPYAGAKLRISEFPIVKSRDNLHK